MLVVVASEQLVRVFIIYVSKLSCEVFSTDLTLLCLCIVCKMIWGHAKAKGINLHFIAHLVVDQWG